MTKKFKKSRTISVKKIECSRCGVLTTHTLYDSETKAYKCNVCGTITQLKK